MFGILPLPQAVGQCGGQELWKERPARKQGRRSRNEPSNPWCVGTGRGVLAVDLGPWTPRLVLLEESPVQGAVATLYASGPVDEWREGGRIRHGARTRIPVTGDMELTVRPGWSRPWQRPTRCHVSVLGIARMNHSCLANCEVLPFDASSNTRSVVTLFDVAKGQELSINYVGRCYYTLSMARAAKRCLPHPPQAPSGCGHPRSEAWQGLAATARSLI